MNEDDEAFDTSGCVEVDGIRQVMQLASISELEEAVGKASNGLGKVPQVVTSWTQMSAMETDGDS